MQKLTSLLLMFTIASQLPSDRGVESLFVESVCFPLERLNTQLLAAPLPTFRQENQLDPYLFAE